MPNGFRGKLLNRGEMQKRDQKIVKLRDDDHLSFATIGKRFGIGRVTAYQAYHREKEVAK